MQRPETGAWAVEGMNSCGTESVAEDRAARMGALTTVVRPSGGWAGVWPGGCIPAGQGEE